jgi:hypothetical protein
MPENLHGKSRLGDVDAFLAVKLAKKNGECPICQEPFVAGENLIERYCCHLVTHVSCLSQWANTTLIKPSVPLQTFSCPKCRRRASRTSYFEILDNAFPPNAEATDDTSAAGKTSTPKTLTEAPNTKPPRNILGLTEPGRLNKLKTTEVSEPQEFSEDEVCHEPL